MASDRSKRSSSVSHRTSSGDSPFGGDVYGWSGSSGSLRRDVAAVEMLIKARTLSVSLLNGTLDAILIFPIGFGVRGAAVATVISEYLIAIILLWELNGKVALISPNVDWRKVPLYVKSGGLLIGRTIATLGTLTLATSLAARQGPIPMAGHQICVQVWLAVSLLTDALALSGQALLATNYSQANYQQAREVIYGVLKFVAGSQPVNAMAFVLDGLYYGVSDFEYAAVVIGLISCAFLVVADSLFSLGGMWTGLFLFMTLRVVAGFWRMNKGFAEFEDGITRLQVRIELIPPM
ncbi:MATE efflux family protein 2 [Hibiscus syriacus]|uniref:MATE efflux family protein 2 n=1 Tax=Hibiscus syriacus TaxID=106335 RepID=A0A6A3A3Z8_HIBSY|nr:MATE efflux family protein 2 [Hibiscus syriacus]